MSHALALLGNEKKKEIHRLKLNERKKKEKRKKEIHRLKLNASLN